MYKLIIALALATSLVSGMQPLAHTSEKPAPVATAQVTTYQILCEEEPDAEFPSFDSAVKASEYVKEHNKANGHHATYL